MKKQSQQSLFSRRTRPAITVKVLPDGRVEIINLVLLGIWFPEEDHHVYATTPLNLLNKPYVVAAEEWEELKRIAPELQEYWPRFSRNPPPPRERLMHFYVPIKFGPCQEPPWLITREQWIELQKHF